MMTPILIALVLAAGELADFDLAFRRADIVARADIVRQADGHTLIVVRQSFKGDAPADKLRAADLSRISAHIRLPADGQHLVFLSRAATGWAPVQVPGVQRRWTREDAGVLTELLGRLALLASGKSAAAADGLVGFATRQARSHADLAHAALLAVARRPDVAPRMQPTSREAAAALLAATDQASSLRATSAQVLAAASDAGLAKTLLDLLAAGRADGLGPIAGRLLRHCRGTGCIAELQSTVARAGDGHKLEVLRAVQATGLVAGQRYLDALAKDPKLGPIVARLGRSPRR